MEYNDLLNLVFDNIRKIIFPKEWLQIDLALSKQELLVLMLLERSGEIIMSRLAEDMHMPLSTVTGIVDRLVKNNYLERERKNTDRRIVLVRLTARGRRLVKTIKDLGAEYAKLIFTALTDEEQQFLLQIVTKVIDIINMKNDTVKSAGLELSNDKRRMTRIEIE